MKSDDLLTLVVNEWNDFASEDLIFAEDVCKSLRSKGHDIRLEDVEQVYQRLADSQICEIRLCSPDLVKG